MPFQKGHKFYKGGEKAWFKKNHKIRIGMKHKPETIEKISKAKMGSPAYWKGKKIPKEARENMSKARMGRFTGENSPTWKGGKPQCKKCGKIITYQKEICYSCFAKDYRGDNHWNWQGGISFEPYSIDWTNTLKRAIKERDKYTCQVCGGQDDLVVHHIDYEKTNCSPENLITLCRGCHTKTNYNRENWLSFFKKTILSLLIVVGIFSANPFKVKADTFGYTTQGGSGDYLFSDGVMGSHFMGAAGTVTSMTYYTNDDYSTGKYALGIYKQSDNTYIGKMLEGTHTGSGGWKSWNANGTITSTAQEYWLVFYEDGGQADFNYDAGATNQGTDRTQTYTYASWPSPFLTILNTRKHSIYATYTPSGGGETTATPSAIFNANTIFNGNIIIN